MKGTIGLISRMTVAARRAYAMWLPSALSFELKIVIGQLRQRDESPLSFGNVLRGMKSNYKARRCCTVITRVGYSEIQQLSPVA